MSKIDGDKLSEFESELKQIKFAAPSDEYLRRGRDIISKQRNSVSSDLVGRQVERSLLNFPFALSTKTVLASTLLALGLIISLLVQGDIRNVIPSETIDTIAFVEEKNSAHELFRDFQNLVDARNENTQEQVQLFASATENYLVANCLSCHERQFIASVSNEMLSTNSRDRKQWLNL